MLEAIRQYWIHEFGKLLTSLTVLGSILLIMGIAYVVAAIVNQVKKRKRRA